METPMTLEEHRRHLDEIFTIDLVCPYCKSKYTRSVFFTLGSISCGAEKCKRTARIVQQLTEDRNRIFRTGGIDQMVTSNETDFSAPITEKKLVDAFKSIRRYA